MPRVIEKLHSIAHDLKTPIARLRNRLEELNFKLSEDTDSKKDLEYAIVQADLLTATLNSILRIARIESQKDVSKFETLSLSSITHDIVELYEPAITDRGIHFEHQTITDAMCRGDKDLIFQEISNLFDNAIKHTPKKWGN